MYDFGSMQICFFNKAHLKCYMSRSSIPKTPLKTFNMDIYMILNVCATAGINFSTIIFTAVEMSKN